MTWRQKLDLRIVGPIIVLLLLSLIILRSLIPGEVGKHFLIIALGISTFIIVSRIDYRILGQLSFFLYLLFLVLLGLTAIFGAHTRGAIRWIEIGGFTVHPSELIKPVMILFLSSIAARKDLKQLRNLALYILAMALPIILVFRQPDLGSSFVLLVIGLSIAFSTGISWKVIGAILGMGLVTLPIILESLKPYQRERLLAYLNPFADPLGSGYHVIQSMIAVGSGKLVGRGLGHGTQSQLRFLPERHSDFVFASLAEELGFLGAFLLLGSYFVLLIHLLRSLDRNLEPLGRLIIVGVFSMLLFQIGVNIGMNLGLAPITGITLPLISSGGSSLVASMASLGLAHGIVVRSERGKTIEFP